MVWGINAATEQEHLVASHYELLYIHQRPITAIKSKILFSLVRLIIDFRGIFSDLAVFVKELVLYVCWPQPLPPLIPLLSLTVLFRVISIVLHLNLSKLKNPPLASIPLHNRSFIKSQLWQSPCFHITIRLPSALPYNSYITVAYSNSWNFGDWEQA